MELEEQIKILTVDDNPVNLFLISTIVKKICPDAIVYEAKNGAEALEYYKQNAPDLLFLDLKLPDIHGLEVAKIIRATDSGKRTPIVVVSANNAEESGYDASSNLIDDFVDKPIKYDSLKAIIDKFILD
ncbi:response regulator [Leeuwenhoekiella aequorea]|uniref:Response regulator receiver domain-containing protein n=1 Tax=Leeuwenhoekiella aequorea TaxID=283736 RepID=A0A4Q0P776_9FLAO|nr:response regulator [Leeuwenhoekiella aequorea]RXG22550.1 response regulator receiver domain-containing protein [Leeuwenhoekiella aequorea]